MGLVEQPQRGAAGDERGQGGPAALSGREAAGRRRAQATGQAQALERPVGLGHGQPEGLHGKVHVLRRAELVVERGGMSQEPHVAPHRGVVRRQVDPEDRGLARGHGQQAGAGPQQAGLAGTVGAHHDDHLALVEREIDPGEGGEAAGECDRGAKVDDRGHVFHTMVGGVGPGVPSGDPPAGRPCQLGLRAGGSTGALSAMWSSARIGSSEVARSPAISAWAKSRSAASWATRRSAVARSDGLSWPIRW